MTGSDGNDGSEEPEQQAEDAGTSRSDDGLELARVISRSLAGAAGRLPRRRGPAGKGGTTGDRKDRRRPRRPGLSGAHPDERDPKLLDDTLVRLVRDQGWELDLRVQAVFGRWAELVGTEVARHTTPESFVDGKLLVRTDSTAWATQLRLLAPTVVRRLNEELGHGTVTLIEVLGPHLPTWKKGLRSMRDGRGPRDTYG